MSRRNAKRKKVGMEFIRIGVARHICGKQPFTRVTIRASTTVAKIAAAVNASISRTRATTKSRRRVTVQAWTKGYSSSLGDVTLYQHYFRAGFENGYTDGWNDY